LELFEELSAIFSEANNLQTWREILNKVCFKVKHFSFFPVKYNTVTVLYFTGKNEFSEF